MPVTYNAPNAWDLLIDNVINNAERTPQSDGTYTFNKTNDPIKSPGLRDIGRQFYPPPTKGGRAMNPKKYHDRVLDNALGEVEGGVVPYNSKPINNEYRPDDLLLDAIKDWFTRNQGQ